MAVTETFNAGSDQSWEVPAGVTSVAIDALCAACGSAGGAEGGPAGGGSAGGTRAQWNAYPVSPGDIFGFSISAGGAGASESGGVGQSNDGISLTLNSGLILLIDYSDGGQPEGGTRGTPAIVQVAVPALDHNYPGGDGSDEGAGGSSAGTSAAGNDAVTTTGGTAPTGGVAGRNWVSTGDGVAGNQPGGGAAGGGIDTDTLGSAGGDGQLKFTYTVAPLISSNGGAATADIDVTEGNTAVTTVAASNSPTFSITGGADAAAFSIVEATGVLTFNDPPDYEIPTDVGGNNTYVVEVTATNAGGTDIQTITVTVLNDTGDDPVEDTAAWPYPEFPKANYPPSTWPHATWPRESF